MLALVSIFLATFAIAALVIWVYRLLFGVQSYEGSTASRKRVGGSMKANAQQGYIALGRKSLKASPKAKTRSGLRVSNNGNKVPWGW